MDRDEELRRRRGEHTRSYSQDKPIGSGENYEAIKRGVKQWLPDLIAAPADMADLAVTGTRKVLQGQKQRTVVPSGYGSTVRGALNRVQPRQQTEMTETPETNWFEEGTRMLNPLFFANPKNALNPLGTLAAIGSAPNSAVHEFLPAKNSILEFLQKNPSLQKELEAIYAKPEVVVKADNYAQGGLVGRQDFNGVVGYILD